MDTRSADNRRWAALAVLGATVVLGGVAAEPFTNSIGMRLLPVAAGEFTQGQDQRQASFRAPWSEEKDRGADWDEAPAHRVRITRDFFMGATEVTNAQFEAYAPERRERRRRADQHDDDAVVGVTWQDAVEFCAWLTKREGRMYRLPTEAEWEYACRAGTRTRFAFGEQLPAGYQSVVPANLLGFPVFFPNRAAMPTYYELVKTVSRRVGQRPANGWGLLDMHGNVEEWCGDWYAPYQGGEQKDPAGPATGDFRVTRGGAHSQFARQLRSANRAGMIPHVATDFIGFRVVQSATTPAPSAARPRISPAADEGPVAAPRAPSPIDQPFFFGPQEYVRIPPGSMGPLFSKHNHDPGVTICPNGDVLVLWYSCEEEPGTELAVAASRLKRGAAEWDPPAVFWDLPDRNDHGPAIWSDGSGTLFHFNGLKQLPGAIVRMSRDSGYTWSAPAVYSIMTQASEATLKTRDGTIISTLDGGPHRATILEATADGGRTWHTLSDALNRPPFAPGNTGRAIAGIHAGVVELKDGRLFALGRFDRPEDHTAFGGKMPQSISSDGGHTWAYSAAELPGIGTGQRFTLKRLREGPLLLCTFTESRTKKDEFGRVIGGKAPADRIGMRVTAATGEEIVVHGMIAALSFDEGATWPVRRLITPGVTARLQTAMDGGRFTPSETEAEAGGYLAMCQDEAGFVHLISSRNYYRFNLAWVQQRARR